MAKKTPPRKFHPTTIRFSNEEIAPVEADRLLIAKSGGIPVRFGAYCKHAAMSYPRLRRIEQALRAIALDDNAAESGLAASILDGAR